jgi:hypothetical protein
MRLPISRSRESLWVWMLWLLSLWLVLEASTFFAVGWVLRLGLRQLAAPYVAFAVPPVVVGPLIYRANRRTGDPPKRRARDMAVAAVVLVMLSIMALYYSGVKLGLMSESLGVTSAIVMSLFGGPIVYFAAYSTSLARLSSRDAGSSARRGG